MDHQDQDRQYYTAYDERYKIAHARGIRWFGAEPTPIVAEILQKYALPRDGQLLEIGCGEGRDARALMDAGYSLLATDVSAEAIAYCQNSFPQYAPRFAVLDCLTARLEQRFDFIFGVAVIHMLVPDKDRDRFYAFIRHHLGPEGIALICSMGDGETEMQSDVTQAFTPVERNHEAGKLTVVGTSCRMVSSQTLAQELLRNGLEILEQGITAALPDFDSLLYAVVRRA